MVFLLAFEEVERWERKDCCRFMRVIREMEDGWERVSFRFFFCVYRDEERE